MKINQRRIAVRLTLALALLASAAAVQTASATSYTQVDLSSDVDLDLVPAAGGPYPDLGTISVGGVAFATVATTSGSTPALGVIGGGFNDPDIVTIGTNVADPTAVYTLINSGAGQAGVTTGQVTLDFASGSSYTYDLIEGYNVRDHYDGSFVNTTSSSDVIGTYAVTSSERLDAQKIVVPLADRGSTLTGITFDTYGYGQPLGSPFLAAATVAAGVPEPATWAMMLVGLGGLGAAMRSRRKFAAAAA